MRKNILVAKGTCIDEISPGHLSSLSLLLIGFHVMSSSYKYMPKITMDPNDDRCRLGQSVAVGGGNRTREKGNC